MKGLNSYIIEKLVINRNLTPIKYKYIVYYRDNTTIKFENYVVLDKLDELENLKKSSWKDKNYRLRIFKCKTELVDDFVDKWEHFNPLPSDDGEEDFWTWFERMGIKEIGSKF